MSEDDQLGFDLIEGERQKEIGMNLAASNRESDLSMARQVAREIASQRVDRFCNIDDVQRVLIKNNIHLGMAAGSVFVGDEWEWTGHHIKSARTTNHARPVRLWRLKGKT